MNADGSQTETVDDYAGTSLISSAVTTISANDLSTTQTITVGGVLEDTKTFVTTYNADGSETSTVSDTNADGSLRDQTVTTTVPHQNTTTISRDIEGNNSTDQTETIAVQSNGSTVDTVSNLNSDGSLNDQRTTTTSANGLSSTVTYSAWFSSIQWVWIWPETVWSFNVFETLSNTTVVNADGSKTETFTQYNGTTTGSIQDQIVATISADGLSTTTQWTGTNGQNSINQAATNVTSINADGSTTQTITDQTEGGGGGSPTTLDNSVTTVSASGLSKTYQLDVNGAGTFDRTDSKVYGLDGGSVETITDLNLDGTLRQEEVVTTSANGLTQSLELDNNGDGVFDHFETTNIETNGVVVDVVWDTNAAGALTDRIVTTTSADGLSKTVQFDTDGSGVVDWTRQTTEVLNADGSRTTTISDFNGNGSLRDQTITTTSADGLSKSSIIDTNGLGNANETQTDLTVLNANGSSTETVTGYYANGSLKDQTITNTSANGLSTTTTLDIDGAGVEESISSTVAVDGSKMVPTNYSNGEWVSTATSFNGLTTTTTTSSGITETTTMLGDSSGSYSWSSTDASGNSLGYSSHTIDANGIDTYVYSGPNGSGTIKIAETTEQQYLSMAENIYDTVFGRAMTTDEQQLIGQYINSSSDELNVTQLVTDLLNASEFSTRYGSLSNVEFVEQIYENAYGVAPSLDELSSDLAQLNGGTITQAGLVNEIAQSSEHLAVGNVYAITNDSVQPADNYSLEHTVDTQVADNTVTQIYEVALGSAPTASELATGAQEILSGSETAAQLATSLVTSTSYWIWWPYIRGTTPSLFEQTYGDLSSSDFVTQLFLNAFGVDPTQAQSSTWVSMLNNGTITQGDLIYAIAESPDALSVVGANAGQSVTASNQTLSYASDATVDITGGGDTINGSSGDLLTIGGNGAAGAADVVNISNGAANLGVNASMDVIGSGDAMTVGSSSNLGVNGNNNTILAGSGDGISINGGTGNLVNASGATIAVVANVAVSIVGAGNTINAQSGSTIGVSGDGTNGTPDAITLSNGTIDVADVASAGVSGSTNAINLGQSDILNITGNGNTITFGANDTVSASGNSEAFVFQSNFGQDALSGFAATGSGHDTLQFSIADFSYLNSGMTQAQDLAAVLANATSSGANTVITDTFGDTLTLAGISKATLAANAADFVFK